MPRCSGSGESVKSGGALPSPGESQKTIPPEEQLGGRGKGRRVKTLSGVYISGVEGLALSDERFSPINWRFL